MGSVESLSQFMPYGAPELLQTRRERLASATLLSTIVIAALFLAAGGVAKLVVVPPVTIPMPEFPTHVIEPPPSIDPPQPQAAQKVRAGDVPEIAVPVPSADVPLEPEQVAGPVTEGADGSSGLRVVSGEPDASGVTPGSDVLPTPEEFVWVEVLPEPVRMIKPAYPELAQQAGVEGTVIVKALVGKNGRVLDVRLDPTRQVPLLNEAALAAAREWRFTPALANGKPVAVWTAIPFRFRLHD